MALSNCKEKNKVEAGKLKTSPETLQNKQGVPEQTRKFREFLQTDKHLGGTEFGEI